MKLCKLIVHSKSFCAEDLLLNQKDFPNLKIGDIVEIYHPEDEFSRLLLQVKLFKEDMQAKDTISVEQSIASTFQLRTYNDVHVSVVNPETVALDSIEIMFKDQYMGRSEMWRLKNSLVNTCVYLNKKIEFCSGSVRCQVLEMWAMGDRVACGVIVDSTKIVFRSLTSMVYLFLQMSSEMWDFDIHGDLYFEKAVNGFLADLFQKWKSQGSNHEVTIVLFSRTFYKAHSLEEFPQYMRECLQQDYKGRFYEDFYRVAVQNEKYEDWSNTLVELRRLFSSYRQFVLEYNNRPSIKVPKAVNSTASQGNFLEVLNMSLNVFEKHYLDRSFDRTGQLSVVITPGVGVFEVDRELTNVTKQRVIDNGVGSDLVCLGEQPLHAVPLFKFHNKDSSVTGDDYSMPHWINLSFYSSNKRVSYSNFIPRIKLPPKKLPNSSQTSKGPIRTKTLHEEDLLGNSAVDYDAYDASVFNVPTVSTAKSSRISKKTSVSGLEQMSNKVVRRKMSDPDIRYSDVTQVERNLVSRTPAITIPVRSESNAVSSFHHDSIVDRLKNAEFPTAESTDSPPCRAVVGSTGSGNPIFSVHPQPPPPRQGRALINPFDPSHITIKLTSNRRRWTHIFPRGPTGNLIQQHHYKVVSQSKDIQDVDLDKEGLMKPRVSLPSIGGNCPRRSTLLWGATGEQEWTPALTTGVDWKSLTIPACLPITTDYFPDDHCIRTDYLFSDYNLLPDDVNADYAQQRVIYRKPLQTIEVFNELVSQRLAQGFQIIVDDSTAESASVSSLVRRASEVIEYKLSIGRIFHRISLTGSQIRVTRYRPKHPYPPFNFHYWYRFQAPDHPTYGASRISFTTEKLENFNWNYFDHYICTRGDTDFALVEKLKYWRFRFFLIPMSQTATKKILEGAAFCDIYAAVTIEEQQTLVDNFLKFVETWVNKIKRQPSHKKQRLDLSGLNMPSLLNRRRYSTGIIFTKTSVTGNSPFRERLGSNRLPEKHRPRSGSKVMEKSKLPSADSFPSPSDSDHSENQESTQTFVLKENTSLSEVVEAMKSPSSRFALLGDLPNLPKLTFVSYEALQWVTTHMEGISTREAAQSFMEKMIKEKYICHASGDFSMGFLNGFYLYSLISSSEDLKVRENESIKQLNGFENEWVEIEVKQDSKLSHESCFLYQNIPPSCAQANQNGPLYKESHLEIDLQGKSDRVEWGHLKYQSVYKPNMAFEMVVQWTAASGAIVADLVYNWARKAQTCGLQLIPIPADPFALPNSLKSDPLRGPVFIPLDTESLMGNRSYLFEEFEEETWAQRLVLFQNAIAIRFGFIACAIESANHQHNQYVHSSGNVFLLIPSLPCVHATQTPVSRSRPIRRTSPPLEVAASPHHEYITRHVGSQTFKQDPGVGFLWSWNHMISRKWRMGSMYAAGDESFQNKLLGDFQEFCSNGNNRLKNFWDTCWSAAKKMESEPP